MSYQEQDEQIWNDAHHFKDFTIDGLFDNSHLPTKEDDEN